MANFGYNAKEARSASTISTQAAEEIHTAIAEAIQKAVSRSMPLANVELVLPSQNEIDLLQGQIAALEEDGFKVVPTVIRETWAELTIIWGVVSDEIQAELEAAKSRIATAKFEEAYNGTKQQLRKELVDRRYNAALNNPSFINAAKAYEDATLSDIPSAMMGYFVTPLPGLTQKSAFVQAKAKAEVSKRIMDHFYKIICDFTNWQNKLVEARDFEKVVTLMNRYQKAKAKAEQNA